MRVYGPYEDTRNGTWFVRVEHYDERGRRRAERHSYQTREKAERRAAREREALARPEETTVQEALDQWIAERTGAVKDVRRLEVMLSTMLDPDLARSIGGLDGDRAEALYDRLVALPVRRGGRGEVEQPRSVAYHHVALGTAKEWGTWLVRKKYVMSNPFADVAPIGRAKRGAESKVWLDPVEIERFGDAAAEVIREGILGDGAIAAYLIYALTLRASEPGTMHAYQPGTPPKARFRLKGSARQRVRYAVRALPEWLAPIFEARVAEGRTLIQAGRVTVRKAVIQLCERAKVPVTCPHGLRESIIDYHAAEAAADGDLDARMMERMAHRHGHTAAVMARHYMAPGRLEDAQAARRLRVLEGGKSQGSCSPTVPREGVEMDSPSEIPAAST